MKQLFLFLVIITSVFNHSQAQPTRYLVRFKDKAGTPSTLSNPSTYLSQRAIDRRTRYGIALDSSDLFVSSSYLSQISSVPNVTILNVSKWINAVSILSSDPSAITTINAFPFVITVNGVAPKPANRSAGFVAKGESKESITSVNLNRPEGTNQDYFDYGSNSFNEIHLHNGEFLHNVGLRGQGMQIALLDDGFFNYPVFHVFDSINLNNQVLGTWDFVSGELNVTNDGSHGMSCFSTIAANVPGQFIGNAPKASFWLFRTENDATEYPIEEFNWVCGAERADSSGTDVISTSVGYSSFQSPLAGSSHTYSEMDGNTIISTIAADLCAKKGILVFSGIGNEGGSSWHYMNTPADADSVVAVGAVNISGDVADFSSYGPTVDGRIKPDVASVGSGALIENGAGLISNGSGTSFACPKMAGLGTCLWQGFPEFNNMRIVRAIQKSGSISSNPNDRIGYGIPDMKLAFIDLLNEFATMMATGNGCAVQLNWTSKDIGSMKYEIERKSLNDLIYSKVGEIEALPGLDLTTHSYAFTDNPINLPDGAVSYRIRQLLDTAVASLTVAYIDTANTSISGCSSDEGEFIKLAPNPSNGPVILIVNTTEAVPKMSISIYDMKGRLVHRQEQSKGPGKTMIDLPIEKLSRGNYMIKVYRGENKLGITELIKL